MRTHTQIKEISRSQKIGGRTVKPGTRLSTVIPLLSLVLLLGGCGGGKTPDPTSGRTPSPSPTPGGQNSVSNWQFSTTSAVPGMPSLTIAGSINLSRSSVTGAMHVDGSSCFDQLTTVALTGTVTGGTISLTSTSVAGQVTSLTGIITNLGVTYSAGQFTGTYSINGGCASGDQGNVTGVKIPYVANLLKGTFTDSGGGTFSLSGDLAQDANASSAGSFGVSGTATLNTPCFGSGTITAGTFPSGSFIIGTSVALQINTGNGIIVFVGTWDMAQGVISGNYTVSGGTCDQTGAAILVASSPWDYGP
jgi:hypothetical protein